MLKRSCQILAITYFLFPACFSFAQRINDVHLADTWFYGIKGIEFDDTGGVTVNNTSNMSAPEGVTTMCDCKTGDILFYSNGLRIWNKLGLVMANGNNISSAAAGEQHVLAVPHPSQVNKYYVFVVDAVTNVLTYNVIDMSDGLGKVTLKNIVLGSPYNEVIAGVYHANNCDIWIVSTVLSDNIIHAWKLSGDSIIGPIVSVLPAANITYSWKISFAPDGKHAVLFVGGNFWGNIGLGEMGLLDFNDSSGVFSNIKILRTAQGTSCAAPHLNCTFSSNSKVLYTTNPGSPCVAQFNLEAGGGNIDSINASRVVFNSAISTNLTVDMQLAPNGKIYISENKNFIGVINYPDSLGTACNFQYNSGIVVGAGTPKSNFPNFIQSFLDPNFKYLCSDFTFDPDDFCFGDTVNFKDSTLGNTAQSWQWDFGDGNTSNSQNPFHYFGYQDTFDVSLATAFGCQVDTVVKTIIVAGATQPDFLGTDTSGCTGDSLTIDLTSLQATGYLWSNGDTTPILTITNSDTVWVNIQFGNVCSQSDTFSLIINAPPGFTPLSDSAMCKGENIMYNIDNSYQYNWSPSGSISINGNQISLVPDTSTTYHLTILDSITKCFSLDTLKIIVNEIPIVKTINDTIIELGSEITLFADGADQYNFSPSDWLSCNNCTNPTVSPLDEITYFVYGLDENGCMGRDTVTIKVVSTLFISNVFAPESSDINDVFGISSPGIKKGHMIIYDKYGIIIFESYDIKNKWDGTRNGEKVAPGVYSYFFTGKDIKDNPMKAIGNVTLIR